MFVKKALKPVNSSRLSLHLSFTLSSLFGATLLAAWSSEGHTKRLSAAVKGPFQTGISLIGLRAQAQCVFINKSPGAGLGRRKTQILAAYGVKRLRFMSKRNDWVHAGGTLSAALAEKTGKDGFSGCKRLLQLSNQLNVEM